ncbi:unnamed protein product [Coccothraustes coccothraustes]
MPVMRASLFASQLRPRCPAPGSEEAASSRSEHCAGGGALQSAAPAESSLRRALSFGQLQIGTVLDVFEGCAENASYVRLRSSRLSSSHALRLPEAKKRLLRALSIVPVAVLSKARVLLKAACDRRLASGSFRLVCSASLSASIFVESFSTLSLKEKLC